MKAVLIMSIAGLFFLNTGCKFFKEHRLFGNDVDSLIDLSEETKPDKEEKVDIQSLDQEVTEEKPEAEVKMRSPQEQAYFGNGRFLMIVGSFRNEHFAERYAEKVRQMGYQTQVIESPNGFYRVSAKSYPTLNQGINELENFRMNVAPRAWIHIQNN